MSMLFGFYNYGLRAMNSARLGIAVSGDNISNVNTPGYAKRRMDLQPGFPIDTRHGLLDQGVEVADIRRVENTLLQRTLEREQGSLGFSDERLRGLDDVESIFGPIDGDGILSAFGLFSQAFDELSAEPENLSLRRTAISRADMLARQMRDTHQKLSTQRRHEDRAIESTVTRVNELAARLVDINIKLVENESDGNTAAPLRDEAQKIVEELSDLTGGTAIQGDFGKYSFQLPGGPTLVTGDDRSPTALALTMTKDADGMTRVHAGGDGRDITDRLSGGRLGALVDLRDNVLAGKIADLNALASELITGANALTTGAFDLNGNPGVAMFQPDPAPAADAAAVIEINPALVQDPRLLAVSATGAPGDGAVAIQIADLPDQASAALGGSSMVEYLTDSLSRLGDDSVQTEIQRSVAQGVVDDLEVRREAVSGVSLDEEAVELLKHQSAYQAAARFIQVLNEVTELTVNLV